MLHKKSLIIATAILSLFLLVELSCVQNTADDTQGGTIYRNPRAYNVEYTFELCPDRDSIDPSKDLKLWIPVPREWDSQKEVKIISVDPEPHAAYTDPEYGNNILFWDFGKVPVKDIYVVKIKYRAEVFEIYTEIDPEQIGSYDKESEEYQLYTRSTYTTNVNSEIREISQSIVGDEKNPYLKANRIFDYVVKNMSYTHINRERGTSIESILNYSVIDSETGEEYFEGACPHYSVFFVALCRAAGIPARGVCGFVGWGPWMEEKDLMLRNERHTLLTSEGLAATRLYGPFGGHIWAEFFLPGYGWIPADPTWNQYSYQGSYKFTITKGRDVYIGPNAKKMDDGVYGDQWIPLHHGRANIIGWGVWNISNIRVAKAKTLHISDPFPADAYAEYATNFYPEGEKEEKLRNWRREHMLTFYNATTRISAKDNIFEIDHRLRADREAYLCQVLCDITGDEKFREIFDTYLKLRLSNSRPVSTNKFQEIAEQVYGDSLGFFFQEWLGNTSLPQISLDQVVAEKREKDWRIYGRLIQKGRVFKIPVDLSLETETGREKQKLWLDSNKIHFEFYTSDQPKRLTFDPDFHIPTIRRMPPCLSNLWDYYPDFIVIYGSLSEAEANKATAERFVEVFVGGNHEIIKADTDVTELDLKTNRIILFGRPETNKISQRFQNCFPIKFENDKFTWQRTIFDQPTQGVAQIVKNPLDSLSMIILYAGLSGDATQKICDISEWQQELDGSLMIDLNSSYIIYDGYNQLATGFWRDTSSALVWNFE